MSVKKWTETKCEQCGELVKEDAVRQLATSPAMYGWVSATIHPTRPSENARDVDFCSAECAKEFFRAIDAERAAKGER